MIEIVDILARYSNRSDLLDDLNRAARQIEQGLQKPGPRRSVSSTDRVNREWSLQDRLSEDQIRGIVKDRQAGTSQIKAAKKYGINESSVKRIMRLHRSGGKIIELTQL